MTNSSCQEFDDLARALSSSFSPRYRVGNALKRAGESIMDNTGKVGGAVGAASVIGGSLVYYNERVGEWYFNNVILPHKDVIAPHVSSTEPEMSLIGVPVLIIMALGYLCTYGLGSTLKRLVIK